MSVTAKTASAGLSILFLLFLGSWHGYSQEVSPAPTETVADANGWATTPQGITIRMVGIAHWTNKGQLWWGMNGRRYSGASIVDHDSLEQFQKEAGTTSQQPCVLFMTINAPAASSIGLTYELLSKERIPSSSYATYLIINPWLDNYRKSGNYDYIIRANLPPSQSIGIVRIGIASGQWQSSTRVHGTGKDSSIQVKDHKALLTLKKDSNGEVYIEAKGDIKDNQRRLVIFSKKGKPVSVEVQSDGWPSLSIWRTGIRPLVHLQDIREIRIEERPYEWVEFPNVHFEPEMK